MATAVRRDIADRDPLVGALGWRVVLLYHDPNAFDRWLWVRRHLLAGSLRTLDAGSGNGAFAMYAAHRGNEVTALSYVAEDQERAGRRASAAGLTGIDFQLRDLRELDRFGSELGQFDQVLCLEVIEHIRDDRKLLSDLAGVIRTGGRLLLTTPHRDHVPFVDEVVHDVEDGHHVRVGYTHEEMARLLAETGFRVASQAYLNGVIAQKGFNVMHRFDAVHPHLGWGLSLPMRLLRPIDRPLTRLIRYPFLSIAVVAIRT
jgi:2-polyprenyl-3-methyl-5-hydroxy-6-metoxy-1,4-benzoquinol methylase